ncbi:unnamed protein product, partial [Polarella glacialis]
DPDVLVSDMFGLLWIHDAMKKVEDDSRDAEAAGDGECNGLAGGVLAGFLSQRNGFGGVAASSRAQPCNLLLFSEVGVELQPQVYVSSDWALLRLVPPSEDGSAQELRQYFSMVALHQQAPCCKPQPVGWCSWYCYGPKVNEELMLDSLDHLVSMKQSGELPFNLFQLDDGWQSAWGDWLSPNLSRFPQGLQPLADRARKAGLVPGLWLAPAACIARSEVARSHPDWLLRDTRGRPVTCGFTAPGLWMLALDITNPEVVAHVKNVIHTIVNQWGFAYIKCDFLHCAAMPGARRFDPTVSRAEALRRLMEAIRQAAGSSTFVLGCGAPLGPCVGLADAMRISADTAEHWLPKGPDLPGTRWFFAKDQTNLPSARNMVRNTFARMPMHGSLWINDPDCLILRDEVPLQEAQALATVAALSAGSLIFSDFVEKVPQERLALLKALLPPLPHAAQRVRLLSPGIPEQVALDLLPKANAVALGPWTLVALFNWSEQSADR